MQLSPSKRKRGTHWRCTTTLDWLSLILHLTFQPWTWVCKPKVHINECRPINTMHCKGGGGEKRLGTTGLKNSCCVETSFWISVQHIATHPCSIFPTKDFEGLMISRKTVVFVCVCWFVFIFRILLALLNSWKEFLSHGHKAPREIHSTFYWARQTLVQMIVLFAWYFLSFFHSIIYIYYEQIIQYSIAVKL